MRHIFSVLTIVGVMAAMLAATAGSALADAQPNEHNCAGSFSSGVTPEFTSTNPPTFGTSVSELAQAGGRDDFIRALAEQLANCGGKAP